MKSLRLLFLMAFIGLSLTIFCQDKESFKLKSISANDFNIPTNKIVNAEDAAVVLYAALHTLLQPFFKAAGIIIKLNCFGYTAVVKSKLCSK